MHLVGRRDRNPIPETEHLGNAQEISNWLFAIIRGLLSRLRCAFAGAVFNISPVELVHLFLGVALIWRGRSLMAEEVPAEAGCVHSGTSTRKSGTGGAPGAVPHTRGSSRRSRCRRSRRNTPGPTMLAPVAPPQLGEFMLQTPRRAPFHPLHDLRRRQMGRRAHIQVHMLTRLACLTNHLARAKRDVPLQHRIPILRHPDKMVLELRCRVATVGIF